jgi:hypothetical protein
MYSRAGFRDKNKNKGTDASPKTETKSMEDFRKKEEAN